MHGDAALSKTIRDREFPDSSLTAEANLLIMPNVDAANISYNLLRIAAGERHHGRRHPARRGQAGAHPDAVGDGAAHRQHDGGRRGRSRRARDCSVRIAGERAPDRGARNARPPTSERRLRITEDAMQAAKKPLYTSLYLQVIVAIVIGVLLGHFFPRPGAR